MTKAAKTTKKSTKSEKKLLKVKSAVKAGLQPCMGKTSSAL